MKKPILTIVFVALSACLLVFQSCKKPKCPDEKPDPCLRPVTVTALSNATINPGHFKAENSGIYLFAINFDQYAAKVTPGKSYKIGYEEVPCEETIICGDQGIAKGGCLPYPKQCIRILCLEEVKCQSGQCMSTRVNPVDYDQAYSQAVSSSGISGSSLDATVSYSGCSANDPVKFALYARHTGQQENGLDVWEAKAVNMGNDFTCMAVFTKMSCFNLSAIKTYYMGPRQFPPAEVLVKLQTANGIQEFVYKF